MDVQALSSSSAERPMASGLERGSRSANRLNHADMSLDPPEEEAAKTHNWLQNKPLIVQEIEVKTVPAEVRGRGAGGFWPAGGCRGGAWNIGGVTQPVGVNYKSNCSDSFVQQRELWLTCGAQTVIQQLGRQEASGAGRVGGRPNLCCCCC